MSASFGSGRSTHPTLADAEALGARARALMSTDDYAAAVPCAEQALTIAHELLEPDDARRIDLLRTVAICYCLSGREPDSLQYFAESVRILSLGTGGPDPRLVADTFIIADLFLKAGEVDHAAPYLTRFIESSRQLDGGMHDAYPGAVRALVDHHLSASGIRAAEAVLDEHMATVAVRVGEDSAFHHHMLTQYTFVLEACGRYADGQSAATQLVTLSESLFGRGSAECVSALGRLASLCRALGQLHAAQGHAISAIAICLETPELGEASLANALWESAEISVAMADIQEAERQFRQAIEIFRTVPGRADNLAQALNGLGNLHRQTGHLADAMMALSEARDLYAADGVHSLAYGQVLSEMAAVHLAGDQCAEAERLMRASLDVIEGAVGTAHPAYARSLRDLGVIQLASGDRAAARITFEAALPALRAALGEHHPLFANHLHGLGDLNRLEGHLADAEPQLTRALEMMRHTVRGTDHRIRTALRSLAGLYAATDRTALAIQLTLEALDGELEMVCQLFALTAQDERSRLLAQESALDALLTLVSRQDPQDAAAVNATVDHVLRRKGMGVEALSAERSTIHAGNHPAQAEALLALRTLRERIAQLALAGPGQEGLEVHTRLLTELEAQRTTQEIALSRDVPELALAARLRTADVAAVRAALPAGSALVEFVQFAPVDLARESREAPRLLAFVLVAGTVGRVPLHDLGVVEPIEAQLAGLRTSVTGNGETRDVLEEEDVSGPEQGGGTARSAAAGAWLRAALFDPLRPDLGEIRRLFISADGALNRLPFEILPTAAGRRLIDDYTISYVGAGRDVLRFGIARSGVATRPIVLADPDFDLSLSPTAPVTSNASEASARRGSLSFGRLPGTRREGEQVGALLGASCHFGADAVERVIKACHSPRILHLATHGFFLPDREDAPDDGAPVARLMGRLRNPMLRSGLALAGANTWLARGQLPGAAEDALLNGEDVSGLDLTATELVVLSACETGLGDYQAGEGVFGLRRAFVLAGAATLIVSLWPVPDRQTQELMCDFYRRLQQGTPRAEALRDAQLALKVAYPDPRFWGAFICVGDPAAMPAPPTGRS
ncbi:MAG: CHAT domain-containing protein [Gemmatimonadaceae bacterium]|nr:CHAT domain-containing protein [Gemmatimonadaceae bacterium]